MKRLLVAFMTLACAFALTAKAADSTDKPKLTKEEKAERKALIEKYDANKDGKLDKEERAKMSKEDKEKWQSFGGGKKKAEKKTESQ
jgi:hypothetical protein